MNKYCKQSKTSQRLRKQRRMCGQKKRFDSKEAAFQKGQEIYECPSGLKRLWRPWSI